MQVSEILRKLADVMDTAEELETPAVATQPEQGEEMGAEVQVTHLEPVEVSTCDDTESDPMVSPLQQQHELMKKSQGVDNHVEEFAPKEEVEQDNDLVYKDQIQAMQKIAGIGEEQQGPVDHAADCRPASLNPRANAALQRNGKEHISHTKHRDQK